MAFVCLAILPHVCYTFIILYEGARSMKRILCVLLLIFLLASLAACGSQTSAKTETSGEASSAAPSGTAVSAGSEAEPEKETITIWREVIVKTTVKGSLPDKYSPRSEEGTGAGLRDGIPV